MKKSVFTSALWFITIGYTFVFCNQKIVKPEKTVEQTILLEVDSFSTLVANLEAGVINGSLSETDLQNLFLQTRLAYKKFEWAAEYYMPEISGLVNGPPVQELEMPYLQVIEPAGLQVIEGFLFPRYDSSVKKHILTQIRLLQSNCEKYRSFFRVHANYEGQVFDAVKLEVFRVMTLGITGFDNSLTLKSMQESAASLESLQRVINSYAVGDNEESLITEFGNAINYLKVNTDFNSFNRMEFITVYCNPLTAGITDLEEKLKAQNFKYNRFLSQEARTLFDTNAFNVNAYAPDHSSFISSEKIALGKKLFSDPILSGTGKRSCQSCHQPEKAFTDGLVKNTIIGKADLLGRNTPTLINAALQPSLFYDMRVNSLEEQSHSVVQSDKEMHGSMTMSVNRLWKIEKYRKMFLTAFPKEDKNKIDTFEIMNAIGSYIRSLVFLNSRFDEYMRGNKTSMNNSEINGFNLFMGKAKCGTCHFMPLFSGNFPPGFKKMESEVIGVPESITNQHIDPDMGRYGVVKVESFRHAFKIPTVRNTSFTAPYMHNGVFSTLDQVLDFYNNGGGVGLGMKIDNQTLQADSLDLTMKERSDIITFIRSLDSKFIGK